jgi:adenylosuccinate lyase
VIASHDRSLNVEVGVTYNLGKATWNKVPDVDAINALHQSELDALNAKLNDANAENDRLKNLLNNQKPVEDKAVKEYVATPVSVFFNIGKSKVASKKDLVNVQALAQYDWKAFGNKFVSEKLGLEREQYTTQISNYDYLGAIFDAIRRINTIIIDLDRDFWMYISMDYFKQKIKAGEVGSSAMPHKVNPIDYENSEGNLGIANAILQFLAQKLPVSRLQRDLTDSTVLRNIGVPLGHSVIAIQSTLKGLRKLILHEEKLQEDLNNTWAVVAEAIQTILRREAYPHPYEALKALTRTNQHMTEETIHEFIQGLNVSDSVKAELMAITPSNYTGI